MTHAPAARTRKDLHLTRANERRGLRRIGTAQRTIVRAFVPSRTNSVMLARLPCSPGIDARFYVAHRSEHGNELTAPRSGGVRDRDATTSGIGSTHRQFSGRYDGLRRGALEGRRTKLNAPDPASKVDSGREDRRVVRRKRNVSLIRVRVRSVCEVRMALAPPPRPAARSASLDALRTRRLDRGLVHHRGLRSRARHEHRTRRPVDQPLCRRPQDPVLEVEAS
jgi:hypothetical protein